MGQGHTAVIGFARIGTSRPRSRSSSFGRTLTSRVCRRISTQKLIDRLHRFDSLTPDEKAKVLNRMESFEHLTPEQQQKAQGLFQRYKAMPADRQSKINQAYRQLRDLPPDQRNQLLSSNEYRGNFSDEELNVLRGMTDLTAPNH